MAMIQAKFPRSQYEGAQQRFDCNAIRYESDGLTILGWMVGPKHAPGGKLPVVIFNRGGNGSFGALKFADLFTHVFPLADQGFLVLASQYRGVTEAEPAKIRRR
jgi:dipeptidyl aminopeptidase/acylaminoacyl peptidase